MHGHIITNADRKTRRGVCAICGPVNLKSRGAGKLRCGKQVIEYRRKLRETARLERRLAARTPCCGTIRHFPPADAAKEDFGYDVGVRCSCGAYWICNVIWHHDDSSEYAGKHPVTVRWQTAVDLYVGGNLSERVNERTTLSWADYDDIDD